MRQLKENNARCWTGSAVSPKWICSGLFFQKLHLLLNANLYWYQNNSSYNSNWVKFKSVTRLHTQVTPFNPQPSPWESAIIDNHLFGPFGTCASTDYFERPLISGCCCYVRLLYFCVQVMGSRRSSQTPDFLYETVWQVDEMLEELF